MQFAMDKGMVSITELQFSAKELEKFSPQSTGKDRGSASVKESMHNCIFSKPSCHSFDWINSVARYDNE